MEANHYSGGCHLGPSPTYGLFRDGVMIGAVAFAVPVSENVRRSIFGRDHVDRVIELHRLHTIDDAPRNASSWFLARCFKMLLTDKPEKRAIISFSDTTEGHVGTTYKALNFYRCGNVSQGNAFKDQQGRLRHRRQCGKNITNAEAEAKGWSIVKRDIKKRFVLIIAPDRRERKLFTRMFLANFKKEISI